MKARYWRHILDNPNQSKFGNVCDLVIRVCVCILLGVVLLPIMSVVLLFAWFLQFPA